MSNEFSSDELIQIADFLNDQTSNTSNDNCFGVFANALDFSNISLRPMECSSNALGICEIEADYDDSIFDTVLPSMPCAPSNFREKRSAGIELGKKYSYSLYHSPIS